MSKKLTPITVGDLKNILKNVDNKCLVAFSFFSEEDENEVVDISLANSASVLSIGYNEDEYGVLYFTALEKDGPSTVSEQLEYSELNLYARHEETLYG